MVATEIFSRGIGIARINLVINFNMPMNCEDYLNRVGRFGTKGMAIAFLSNEMDKKICKLVKEK